VLWTLGDGMHLRLLAHFGQSQERVPPAMKGTVIWQDGVAIEGRELVFQPGGVHVLLQPRRG